MNIEYSTTSFPGEYTLSGVYKIRDDVIFESVDLENDTIRNVPIGEMLVSAVNVSEANRRSPFNLISANIDTKGLPKPTNLSITESLYREQTGGVSVRATIAFKPPRDKRVTDFIVEYQFTAVENVESNDGGTPLLNKQSEKISASKVDTDGFIRMTVDGINRGTTNRNNEIIFNVTSINKSLVGGTASARKTIVGKTAPPNNISEFTGSQKDETINFQWKYAREDNGELKDIDLKEVVIKRLPGEVAATISNFIAAQDFIVVADGSSRKSAPTQGYGTFTYLVRTVDTSGNYSESVVRAIITTTQTASRRTIRNYNEAMPSANNAGEVNWPSVANTATNGDPLGSGATTVDKANGASSGWAFDAVTGTTILATDDAYYQTKIRDLGREVVADISIATDIDRFITTQFNEQFRVVETGVSDNVVSGGSGSQGGIYNQSYADWGTPIVPTRITLDAEYITTDGVYPTAPGSSNVAGYGYEGTLAVYSNATTQTQLAAFGGTDNGFYRHAVRTRTLPNGNWGSWDSSPDDFFWSDTTDTSELLPKILYTNNAAGTPTEGINDRQRSAIGLLYRPNAASQQYYIGHYGNRVWTRSAGAVTPPEQISNISFKDSTLTSKQGIGEYLLSQPNLYYSDVTHTLQANGVSGSVYALRNPGQFTNDTANAGSFALLSGVLDANTVLLGETYYANGVSTGTNVWANSSSVSYQLIDLIQYSDLGQLQTFSGELGAISENIRIRKAVNSPYYSNGAINISSFEGHEVNDGWQPFSPGFSSFRYFQIRADYDNKRPLDYDLSLKEFGYAVSKQISFINFYERFDGAAKTISISNLNFENVPFVNLTAYTSTPHVHVITAVSTDSITFNLYRADNGQQLTETGVIVLLSLSGV